MTDKFYIGIALVLISLVCLPLHLSIIWLFVSKKEYGERMSFKIMTSLGVVDCLHLLAHFMTGLMTILHTRIHVVVERVTGTLILSSWVGMAGMIFALALNRIAVLTSVKLTKSREKSLFYALATIIWLSYIAVTGLHLTNDGAVSYRIRESSFSYVLTDLNYYLEKYESYWILFLLIMAFICYVGIVVWIVLHKNFRPTHLKIERREVKILIQAIIIFVYMATLRSIWHLGPQWYLKNVAVVDTLNILTCLVGGVNPLLYLTFNRSIRNHFFAMIRANFAKHRTSVEPSKPRVRQFLQSSDTDF
ncbi:hypothetical protein QR680_010152 [Steinernema hermaphroditum]|uniref:G-protein coupled receptors family 1 profile domain-containing protein n=1 Tax=Steinernema hermaphroditum TaxID=289476 RepID=A0AA39IPV2_9BILA|nr:hypothetical protein QR680_010152 [Steinernema hermaphroditum]